MTPINRPVCSFSLRELKSRSVRQAELVVCAWGGHGSYMHRDAAVRQLLDDVPVYHLGSTRHGHPRHPLYLPADARLERW